MTPRLLCVSMLSLALLSPVRLLAKGKPEVHPPARLVQADPAPNQFLQAIYVRYVGEGSKGLPLDTAEQVKQTFTPTLAAQILADRAQAKKRHRVPALDGDPFLDAQEWNIEDLSINVEQLFDHKATGTVKFSNLKQPQTVKVELEQVGADWRVSDVLSEGKRLTALFPKAPPKAKSKSKKK